MKPRLYYDIEHYLDAKNKINYHSLMNKGTDDSNVTNENNKKYPIKIRISDKEPNKVFKYIEVIEKIDKIANEQKII